MTHVGSVSRFHELREKARLSVDQAAELLGYSSRRVYDWDKGVDEPRAAVLNLMEHFAAAQARRTRPEEPEFRFVDLFAGIGGLRMGFESIGGECVFTSEWDKACRQTYAANYGCDEHPFEGDITQVPVGEIPDHDVLLAGFPCQPFSIAGVSKKTSLGRAHGFLDETQGTLFFDVVRILEAKRPAAFLMENVKNLQSHDRGKTFEVIRGALDELGYGYTFRVVNGKGYVPQNRERIFIAGFREDCEFDLNTVEFRDPSEGPVLQSILHPEDGSETIAEGDDRYLDARGHVRPKYTLSDKLWSYLQAYREKHTAAGNGFGFGLVTPDMTARTLSARYYKDGSEILVDQPGRRPRRLTPRECARLMGFDQPGREPFVIPVSDTQAYKQFGNAVVVPVVEHIAREMKPYVVDAVNRERAEPSSGLLPLAAAAAPAG